MTRLRVRHLASASPVPGLTPGCTYEILEIRDERAWMRQRVLLDNDTGARIWHRRSHFVPDFSLWLEFELWEDPPDAADFANVKIILSDGRVYAANVWTHDFFAQAVAEDARTGQNLGGLYLIPPDLFVRRLTRDDITRTVEQLLREHQWDLPTPWRVEPDDE
ncbi:MAG: hypothetical protein EOO74_09155 [Myxococcales bacterium]|nr:MAG: hypothetical protein EOO74_09155 [Myxococcales bacterium]